MLLMFISLREQWPSAVITLLRRRDKLSRDGKLTDLKYARSRSDAAPLFQVTTGEALLEMDDARLH